MDLLLFSIESNENLIIFISKGGKYAIKVEEN